MENPVIMSLILILLVVLRVNHFVGGITGGRLPEVQDRYDFVVSLQEKVSSQNVTKFEHFCGATLIESQWIVTAAHCIYSKNVTNIFAVIGEKNLRSKNIIRSKIIKILQKFFNPNILRNDIALLKLEVPTMKNFHKIKPIPLYRSIANPVDLVSCKILGFGATQYGGDPQDNLLIANVSILTYEKCYDILGRIMAPERNSNCVCAMGSGTDTCQGDSGGPLICSNGTVDYLFAITSHGITCGANGVPSIYTLVQPYLKWIHQIKQTE